MYNVREEAKKNTANFCLRGGGGYGFIEDLGLWRII